MNYNTLLDMAAELGYRLAMNGAETFRVEESVNRVMKAYGINAEAFAIPNCLHVSIETAEGKPMTRMRRIGYHGNDLEAVERYSNLSRRICDECPDPTEATQWLNDAAAKHKAYRPALFLLGSFLGGCGFGILFGGSYVDAVCAGICATAIGVVNLWMDRLKANPLFRTVTAAFIMALIAYSMGFAGITYNVDAVIIGALMSLVPGLLFTNAMRDIIYGDTNSGINRIVQVFLIAVTIALGTGAAWKLICAVMGTPNSADTLTHPLFIEALACFISCIGFSVLFNIHGTGVLLCAFGGVVTWVIYRLVLLTGTGDITAYFFATVCAALFSEVMARVRKSPAIGYLVISAFPLIPGAGVYYTMNHALRGDMAQFTSQGMHTLSIAGIMAVGILLISTVFRFVSIKKQSA